MSARPRRCLTGLLVLTCFGASRPVEAAGAATPRPARASAALSPVDQDVPAADPTSDRVLPTAPALRAAADSARTIVRRLRSDLELPGLAVAVAAEGGILWSEGVGYADIEREIPVTRHSVFPIYSVSKGLTGTALARLHQSGQLDLDGDVRRYLPWLPARYDTVTLRQLAAHLGGVRHYRPGAGEGTELVRCRTERAAVARFAADSLVQPPGSAFHYTSYGFVLLSAAMAAASGEGFEEMMTRTVLEPYALGSTTIREADVPIRRLVSRYEHRDSVGVVPARRMDLSCKLGAGAYYSTAEDVARLAVAMTAGEGLTPEAHQLLLTPQRDASGATVPASLGWDVVTDSSGHAWLRRTGGNVDAWSAVMASTEGGVAVALLANMRGRDWIHDEAARIASLFLEARRSEGPSRGDLLSTRGPLVGSAATAFVGVHLLPMDRDTVLQDQVLVVEDDRIVSFGPQGSTAIPSGARRIDAAGSYLLPGLVDAHAHAGAEALPLYLASGVTTVRMMHGSPERLERRRRQREEAVPWPTILTAGPLIAGQDVPWPEVVVETPAAARRVVGEQARAGYDFLKVYEGLSRPAYDALARRSRRLGIPFVGHVPVDVGVRRALEAGQRTIEHAEQLLYATFGRSGIMQLPVARTDSIVRVFERHGEATCLTPTLWGMTLAMRRGTPFTDSLFGRLDWTLVDPGVREWWRTYRSPAPEGARPRREHFLDVQRALTRALHEAGVPLLAGTDAPYPLLTPGASLVEEVKTLADLGLSRFEALATATANAGRCLAPEGGFGVLRAGARADLLLLPSNPLADLGSLSRPQGVMVRGRWFDEEALAALPGRVREAYRSAVELRIHPG